MLETETPKTKAKISRKTLYGIVVFVIVVFAGVVIYLFASSSPYNVRIVRFFLFEENSHVLGNLVVLSFYVKIENLGSNNVSGMVLVVKVLDDYHELGRDTVHIDTLQPGLRKTFSIVVRVNTTEFFGKYVRYVATLYLGDTIIDENATPSKY